MAQTPLPAPGDCSPPAIVVVDDRMGELERLDRELSRRYAGDYRIVAEPSAPKALATLRGMHERGEPVALVMAEQWMAELTGGELLASLCALHPRTRRALLVDWGAWTDRATADAILDLMEQGQIDYYVVKPRRERDEFFHRAVTEFLHEWMRAGGAAGPEELELTGNPWSPRVDELRDLLMRNGVPYAFHDPESPEAREIAAASGHDPKLVPLLRIRGGTVLADPSNADLARAYGAPTRLDRGCDYDVVVVGAGPAGLSAAVYASSEGLRTLVVEREAIGGQAGTSSLIRNYLGFARGVSGAELAQRAYQQAWVFGTEFLVMTEVRDLRRERGRSVLTLGDGTEVTAGAVVLATGVSYRRLEVRGLDRLHGAGVFYGASLGQAHAAHGQHVFIVGGGNSAGQAAMHLSRFARDVTVLVRSESLDDSMSQYLRAALDAMDNVTVRTAVEVSRVHGRARLEQISIRDRRTGRAETLPAGALFILIGARPHTEWLPASLERDASGFIRTGPQVTGEWSTGAPPQMLETSIPGVFAIGDVRERSVKRVASAVGEGSVVMQNVFAHLEAEEDAAAAEPIAVAQSGSPTREGSRTGWH